MTVHAPERGRVQRANPRPCAACPWRLDNQGKRHPHGWYTKANLRRLWSKLRSGDSMTCHPTDPENVVPEGHGRPVPEGATTHECSGALILQQREWMKLQAIAQEDSGRDTAADLAEYRRRSPLGLTREGIGVLMNWAVFGGSPLGGDVMPKPDLNEPGIGHQPLGDWDSQEWARP